MLKCSNSVKIGEIMIKIIKSFKKYIYDNLGITVVIKDWNKNTSLPLFLQDLYEYFFCTILDIPCLLIVGKGNEDPTPATLKKHLYLLQEKSGFEPIYLKESISAHNRKRLIEHKISFIIPDNQMYLPFSGIDLRSHIKKIRSPEVKSINPSTQAVLLFSLYNGNSNQKLSAAFLAEMLGYSIMTINRVFNELHSTGLGLIFKDGREFNIHFDSDRRMLWRNSLGFLRSPILKKIYVPSVPKELNLPISGFSALSHYSMLSEPQNITFAISSTEFNSIKNAEKIELQSNDPEAIEIEIWSYSPYTFSENGFVDRLSLFLILRDSEDERVELALEEMMENIKW